MAFKFISFLAIVAAANAGLIPATPIAYSAPIAAKVATPVLTKSIDADYDPHPQYSYSYDVQDSLTGDSKNQHETRDGDVVHGSYSLLEADGTRRIVDYTADPVNGFNAVVHKEGNAVAVKAVAAPAVAIKHAPVAYAAAPAHISYSAPQYAPAHISYSAPQYAYAAPAVAKLAHLSYAAPAQAVAAHPVAYAAPTQIAYAAKPALAYGAPIAKIASPSFISHVAYNTPLFSYSH